MLNTAIKENLKNTKSSLTYISSHNFKPGQRTLPPSALLKTFHLANSFRIFYLRPTFAKPQQHPGDTTPAGSDPRKFQGSTTRCPRACRTPTSPAPRGALSRAGKSRVGEARLAGEGFNER